MSNIISAFIRNKISNIISRAIITAIAKDKDSGVIVDGGKVYVQVKTKSGNKSDVELLQQYGFRSIPLPGSRGILISYGGDKDNASVINVDDKRYGQFEMEEGDVMLYNSNGSRTIFKENSIITTATEKHEVNIGSTKVLIDTSKVEMTVAGKVLSWDGVTLEVDGKIHSTGNIDSDTIVEGQIDVIGGGKSLATHPHSGVQTGGGISGPPV